MIGVITYNILLLIETIAIFFQGFSFGRRYTLGLLISSLVILSISVLSVILDGIVNYAKILLNVDIYEAMITLIYVLFWWILGYIIGRIRRIKAENMKVKKIV